MNICFFSDIHISQQRGGVERVTFTLAQAFSRRGHNIIMLSALEPINNDILLPNQFLLPEKPTYTKRNISFASKLFKERGINVIINQSETLSTYNFLKESHSNIPIITCFHTSPKSILKKVDDDWDLWKLNIGTLGYYIMYPYIFLKKQFQLYFRRKYIKEKFRKLYAESDAIVLLSEKYIKPFLNVAKIRNSEKIFAIHNPELQSKTKNDAKKEDIILFVGRLVFHPKRIDRLLKIWSKIKTKKHWRLIIVGDGPDKDFFRSLNKELGNKNVEFVGIQEPTIFYQKAKILCLTSTYEGSPCVIREALSHNIIPISFGSFESATDYITTGINGFVIKPFSLKQYTKILSRLINDKGFVKKIQNNIIQDLNKQDSINERIINEWETLFTKLHKNIKPVV